VAQGRVSGLTGHSVSLPGIRETGPALVLIAVGAGCWVVTANRMGGMDMGPGTELGGLGWFVGVWATMMAAMMLPSLVPMGATYVRAENAGRAAAKGRSFIVIVAFATGYLLPWVAAGLAGYALIEGIRSSQAGFLAWENAGPYVAAAVIAGAALYELTPMKAACLRHCRDPRLLVERRRPGRLGALWTGIEHGGFCVGCCWALMAALFALGVMSIGWMVLIAAVIAIEKLVPRISLASLGIVIVLAALAVSVAFAPDHVPGLTIPDSAEAMPAMDGGGMDSGMNDKPAGTSRP
jgi:predicted metal-binding membrane protein